MARLPSCSKGLIRLDWVYRRDIKVSTIWREQSGKTVSVSSWTYDSFNKSNISFQRQQEKQTRQNQDVPYQPHLCANHPFCPASQLACKFPHCAIHKGILLLILLATQILPCSKVADPVSVEVELNGSVCVLNKNVEVF